MLSCFILRLQNKVCFTVTMCLSLDETRCQGSVTTVAVTIRLVSAAERILCLSRRAETET